MTVKPAPFYVLSTGTQHRIKHVFCLQLHALTIRLKIALVWTRNWLDPCLVMLHSPPHFARSMTEEKKEHLALQFEYYLTILYVQCRCAGPLGWVMETCLLVLSSATWWQPVSPSPSSASSPRPPVVSQLWQPPAWPPPPAGPATAATAHKQTHTKTQYLYTQEHANTHSLGRRKENRPLYFNSCLEKKDSSSSVQVPWCQEVAWTFSEVLKLPFSLSVNSSGTPEPKSTFWTPSNSNEISCGALYKMNTHYYVLLQIQLWILKYSIERWFKVCEWRLSFAAVACGLF